MNTHHNLLIAGLACWLTIQFAGCGRRDETTAAGDVRIEDNQIVVTPGSPPSGAVMVTPSKSPGPTVLILNARLVWDDNATTRLFTPFAGRVTKIPVEVGQPVQPGDALALIASPDYGQAQADARRAETDLVLAERTLARTRELLEHGAAAQKDLQAAEADVDRGRAEKERATERLALYGGASEAVDQAYTLKAPIAGVVVEKNINTGAELRSDLMLANAPQLAAPLFVITDPTHLWVQIDVPERDASHVRAGQSFTIRTTSIPGESFPGRVQLVSDSLDPTTRTVKARGSVANGERRLKAEMFVKAEFELDPESGAEVPARAVFLRGERHFVMVEDGPGRYSRHEVTIGSERSGRIVISHGLEPGRRVVVDGAMLLEQVYEDSPGS